MKQAIILRCRPCSMFHFGRVAIDADTSLNDTSIIPHSDTIFSAMVNLASRMFSDVELSDFLNLFGLNENQPKIRISSAFYCIENNKNEFLYFLPKPLVFNLEKTENHKDLKKVQFISKSVWEKGLKPSDWLGNCEIIDKRFVVTRDELQKFNLTKNSKLYEEISLPKVAIHKETKDGSFYYQTNIQLADIGGGNKVHFYFLLDRQGLEEKEISMINEVLYLLPYEGIGGERSTGCGLFDNLLQQDFDLKSIQKEHFVSVSLANPNTQAEFTAFENYQIVVRGGRRVGDSNGKFLKKVNMIAEGAVLKQVIRGRIVSISPFENQPYLRNGICLALPYPKIN